MRLSEYRAEQTAMQIEHKGDQIILTIDVSEAALKAAQPSSSGKTLLVATTNGFRRKGLVSVLVNCTVPNPDYVRK
jgi:predicted GNAT family acetyltransferase